MVTDTQAKGGGGIQLNPCFGHYNVLLLYLHVLKCMQGGFTILRKHRSNC